MTSGSRTSPGPQGVPGSIISVITSPGHFSPTPHCNVDRTRFSTGSLIFTFRFAITNAGRLCCARYVPVGSLCAMCKADYHRPLYTEVRMLEKNTKDMVSGYALQSVLFTRVLSFHEWLLREQGQNI